MRPTSLHVGDNVDYKESGGIAVRLEFIERIPRQSSIDPALNVFIQLNDSIKMFLTDSLVIHRVSTPSIEQVNRL